MTKLALVLAAPLIFSIFALPSPENGTFTGEIMDSRCATVGTHDRLGYQLTKTHNPKDCTLACVKMGSEFVLYDAVRKIAYALDNQKKPEQFAGKRVRVKGRYDAATNTIHVTDIQLASTRA